MKIAKLLRRDWRILLNGLLRGRATVREELEREFRPLLLTSTTEQDLRRFNEAVRRIPEIESCLMIAGDFDYLLKVRTRDINEYRRVMGEQISSLPCVKQTHTYVVMEAVKDEHRLPLRPLLG